MAKKKKNKKLKVDTQGNFLKKLPNIQKAEDIERVKNMIKDFFERYPGNFYMFLSNLEHHFTLFVNKPDDLNKMADNVWEHANSLGGIKEVKTAGLDHIQFYIDYKDKIVMFALFNYDRGVINNEQRG